MTPFYKKTAGLTANCASMLCNGLVEWITATCMWSN